jgi:hypothetical protein
MISVRVGTPAILSRSSALLIMGAIALAHQLGVEHHVAHVDVGHQPDYRACLPEMPRSLGHLLHQGFERTQFLLHPLNACQ